MTKRRRQATGAATRHVFAADPGFKPNCIVVAPAVARAFGYDVPTDINAPIMLKLNARNEYEWSVVVEEQER